MIIESIEKSDVVKAATLIGQIDSGEKSLFIEHYELGKPNGYYEAVFFRGQNSEGVFFSFSYNGKLRVHIAFDSDLDADASILIEYVKCSLKTSGHESAMIWIKNENRKIIQDIKNTLNITGHQYESIEYAMSRECFSNKKHSDNLLVCRPYEEKDIDSYLQLLDESMTFCIPPCNFIGSKEKHMSKFQSMKEKGLISTFWNEEGLVGIYWRKGCEIDTIAVSPKHQRKGYGSYILTHALQQIFNNEKHDIGYLYCVDWNEKGQSFYKSYGMAANSHSYLLTI